MIRIAACGDLHIDQYSCYRFARHFPELATQADLLLLAGDLTQRGHPDEMKTLAKELKKLVIPVIAVLGNHDYHSKQVEQLTRILEDHGVIVLENSSTTIMLNGKSVGISGTKGFGGGFRGACGSQFGEDEMKRFMECSKQNALDFQASLANLDAEYKIALMHYSPIKETLEGEKKEIYPFLGCYYFAEAIDFARPTIVFHGHAHYGKEKGATPLGIPVRNVAQPVIKHAYNVYILS